MRGAGSRSRALALSLVLVGFFPLSLPGLPEGTPKASGQITIEQSIQNGHTRGPSDEIHEFLVQTTFELSLGVIDLDWETTLERGERTHTQKTYLSRRHRAQEHRLSLSLDPFVWKARVQGREVLYPDAPRKDSRRQAHVLEGGLVYEGLRLEGAVTQEVREFPNASRKDERRDALSLAAGAGAGTESPRDSGVLIEATYSRLRRRFPNDPDRSELRRELGVQWEAGGSAWAVEVALAHERRDFPRDPRRNQREWKRSLRATLPGGLGELTLEGTLSDVDRPENPGLTRRFRRLRADLQLLPPWGELQVRLTRDTIRYPYDPDRDRGVWEALLTLEGEWEPWVLSAAWEHEITGFPQDPVRDKRVIRWEAEVTWTRDPWSVSLAGEVRDIRYPNDPVRDARRLSAEFLVKTELLRVLTVTLEGEWRAWRFPPDPLRNTTTTALSLTVKLAF